MSPSSSAPTATLRWSASTVTCRSSASFWSARTVGSRRYAREMDVLNKLPVSYYLKYILSQWCSIIVKVHIMGATIWLILVFDLCWFFYVPCSFASPEGRRRELTSYNNGRSHFKATLIDRQRAISYYNFEMIYYNIKAIVLGLQYRWRMLFIRKTFRFLGATL